MTMEMWRLGFYIDPLRLILLMTINARDERDEFPVRARGFGAGAGSISFTIRVA
jgi:hypothetical protein